MRRQGSRGAKSRRAPRKALAAVKLEAMARAATIDCYNESEEITGWFTTIEENLATPFETRVLGAAVTIERIELNEAGQIVAVWAGGIGRRSRCSIFPCLGCGRWDRSGSRRTAGG